MWFEDNSGHMALQFQQTELAKDPTDSRIVMVALTEKYSRHMYLINIAMKTNKEPEEQDEKSAKWTASKMRS